MQTHYMYIELNQLTKTTNVPTQNKTKKLNKKFQSFTVNNPSFTYIYKYNVRKKEHLLVDGFNIKR